MKPVGITIFVMLCILLGSVAIAAEGAAQDPSSPAPSPLLSAPSTSKTAPKQSTFDEDWSSITLSSSVLAPEPPALNQRVDIPGNNFVRELYRLSWRPGEPLDLYVIKPRDVKNPPVILYLYSFPHDTQFFKQDAWCESAVKSGYAAVGFVSALTGHRLEYRGPKDWFVSQLQEALASSTHDVQMILNYLATRGDLDMDHVGMFGQGSGGAIAIMASAADPRIKTLDLLNPWGDWPNWLPNSKEIPEDERANYLRPEFQAHVAQLDPVKWFPKVQAKSVRLQDVRKIGSVPDMVQETLEAAAPETTVINQYADARAMVPEMSGDKLFDWVKSQLRADAKPSGAADKSSRVHFYADTNEKKSVATP